MSTSETEKETQFDAVYNELFDDVYAYFHVCFGEQSAEDLAQEAFLRVWRAVDSGKIPDNWRAWVFRCAVNLKNDFLRRKYTESGAQNFETAVLPATAAPDEGETLAVKNALSSLTGTDREVLTLKSMGFTSDEIGELLSISGSAVRTRLQKAKQNFQNALETEGVKHG